jgi:hypothetical protein
MLVLLPLTLRASCGFTVFSVGYGGKLIASSKANNTVLDVGKVRKGAVECEKFRSENE